MDQYTVDFISHIFSITENIKFVLTNENNLTSSFTAYAFIFMGFVLITIIFKFVGFAETKNTKILIVIFCLLSIFPLSLCSFYLGNHIIKSESKYINSIIRSGNEIKIFNDFKEDYKTIKKEDILRIKVIPYERNKEKQKICIIKITTKGEETFTVISEHRKMFNINHPGC